MADYIVYARRLSSYKLPREASNAEKYWRIYEGPLDEVEMPYASARGTYPIPDATDDCLWKDGRALIPLSDGTYAIRAGNKPVFWKYNGHSLVLENEFDSTGVRWHPHRSLGKIHGVYQKCVHSTKRTQPSWRVLPSCPNPGKYPSGNHYHLPFTYVCYSCGSYQYDRSLERSKP